MLDTGYSIMRISTLWQSSSIQHRVSRSIQYRRGSKAARPHRRGQFHPVRQGHRSGTGRGVGWSVIDFRLLFVFGSTGQLSRRSDTKLQFRNIAYFILQSPNFIAPPNIWFRHAIRNNYYKPKILYIGHCVIHKKHYLQLNHYFLIDKCSNCAEKPLPKTTILRWSYPQALYFSYRRIYIVVKITINLFYIFLQNKRHYYDQNMGASGDLWALWFWI